MNALKIFIIPALLFMALAVAAPAASPVTEDEAVVLAKEFLAKQKYASQYETSSPVVSLEGDLYYVQFSMKRKNVKPGICIISVNRKTREVKIVPVE